MDYKKIFRGNEMHMWLGKHDFPKRKSGFLRGHQETSEKII